VVLSRHKFVLSPCLLLLIVASFIIYLNWKWVFTRWQCTTIRHNTQITHHTQINTAHKTTQTIKDTLHTMKGHTTRNERTHYTQWKDTLHTMKGHTIRNERTHYTQWKDTLHTMKGHTTHHETHSLKLKCTTLVWSQMAWSWYRFLWRFVDLLKSCKRVQAQRHMQTVWISDKHTFLLWKESGRKEQCDVTNVSFTNRVSALISVSTVESADGQTTETVQIVNRNIGEQLPQDGLVMRKHVAIKCDFNDVLK
jgi:hypothetical protein